MPGFIRNKKDEARWSKAKSHVSATKTKKESNFDDQDWALVNHIYHTMHKAASVSTISDLIKSCLNAQNEKDFDSIMSELQKARGGFSDEDIRRAMMEESGQSDEPEDEQQAPDYEESDLGYDPEDQESQNYLKELEEKNYGKTKTVDKEPGSKVDEPVVSETETGREGDPAAAEEKRPKEKVKFSQPSVQELNEIREHTLPLKRRLEEKRNLEASHEENPVLHKEGLLLEANTLAHKPFEQAMNDFASSQSFNKMTPSARMKAIHKFKQDWHTSNPDHLPTFFETHSKAHQKGNEARQAFESKKEADIDAILRGGVDTPQTAMSAEAAFQHAGGTRSEEGATGGGIEKNPLTDFASKNKAFLARFATERSKKQSFSSRPEEMLDYDAGKREDAKRILGDPPTLKDPTKKAKFDSFISHYHPLIAINSHKLLQKLGVKPESVDEGLLHEAGMEALYHAINEYDHDNPKKASFPTFASKSIYKMMHGVLGELFRGGSKKSAVPAQLERQAREFGVQSPEAQPHAAPVKIFSPEERAKFAQERATQAPKPAAAVSPAVASTPPSPSPPAESSKPVGPKPSEVVSGMKNPQAQQMGERLKRVDAARASNIILRKKPSE